MTEKWILFQSKLLQIFDKLRNALRSMVILPTVKPQVALHPGNKT
jgi:hypothetical protein